MPEQQMVEIAKAIGASATIFIMDEPTASLTDREVDKLFEVIRTLRSDGAGIIYISHRLEEISAIADRVTVLRDGETVATRSMQGIDRAELIRMMVGRPLSAVFPKRETPIGDIVLEIRAHGEPLTLRSGEIVGLAGLVGSGRTELAEALFGLRRADSASVLLRNREVLLRSPADAIESGIAYVPEDRRQHGVIMQMPVAANTSLATLKSISRRGLLDDGRERELAVSYIDRLGIKTSGVYAETGSLSGGNQQKVALARWLATHPSVLILDEPTQGVDVASKAEIHRLIVELAAQGLAILMISSELSEILGMSDRVAVMHEGGVAAVLPRAEATPQRILSLALGHP
jgi:rhamnose transport system ATP-binding protein